MSVFPSKRRVGMHLLLSTFIPPLDLGEVALGSDEKRLGPRAETSSAQVLAEGRVMKRPFTYLVQRLTFDAELQKKFLHDKDAFLNKHQKEARLTREQHQALIECDPVKINEQISLEHAQSVPDDSDETTATTECMTLVVRAWPRHPNWP